MGYYAVIIGSVDMHVGYQLESAKVWAVCYDPAPSAASQHITRDRGLRKVARLGTVFARRSALQRYRYQMSTAVPFSGSLLRAFLLHCYRRMSFKRTAF
jgi:hypothetical protein